MRNSLSSLNLFSLFLVLGVLLPSISSSWVYAESVCAEEVETCSDEELEELGSDELLLADAFGVLFKFNGITDSVYTRRLNSVLVTEILPQACSLGWKMPLRI